MDLTPMRLPSGGTVWSDPPGPKRCPTDTRYENGPKVTTCEPAARASLRRPSPHWRDDPTGQREEAWEASRTSHQRAGYSGLLRRTIRSVSQRVDEVPGTSVANGSPERRRRCFKIYIYGGRVSLQCDLGPRPADRGPFPVSALAGGEEVSPAVRSHSAPVTASREPGEPPPEGIQVRTRLVPPGRRSLTLR